MGGERTVLLGLGIAREELWLKRQKGQSIKSLVFHNKAFQLYSVSDDEKLEAGEWNGQYLHLKITLEAIWKVDLGKSGKKDKKIIHKITAVVEATDNDKMYIKDIHEIMYLRDTQGIQPTELDKS